MEMGVFMKANFLTICQMEQDAWNMQIKINIRGNSNKVEKKEKVPTSLLMVQYSKEYGRTTLKWRGG